MSEPIQLSEEKRKREILARERRIARICEEIKRRPIWLALKPSQDDTQ